MDISDRSNTAAAFSFLREIESQKQDQDQRQQETIGGEESTHGFRGKLKFNRSIKLKSRLEEEDNEPAAGEQDKPKVKGSKVVMPEYVIGQKQRKSKPVKLGTASSKRDRANELKLDHLIDEEDNSEDDEGMD